MESFLCHGIKSKITQLYLLEDDSLAVACHDCQPK